MISNVPEFYGKDSRLRPAEPRLCGIWLIPIECMVQVCDVSSSNLGTPTNK
jgi:hypothetical protein